MQRHPRELMSPKAYMDDGIFGEVSAVAKVVLGLVLALGLAAVICLAPSLMPLAIGLMLLAALVGVSRLTVSGLLISYILADHICQLMKRVIFQFGPQPIFVYYGFQLVPSLILLLAVASSCVVLSKQRLPRSTILFSAFIFIGTSVTLLNPNGTAFQSRLAGINQGLLPFLTLFVGMALPFSAWRRVVRLFITLIIISVTYGFYQFLSGPTAIDKAWAYATADYSIEGLNVYRYLIGASNDFRVYSYYADFQTWGLFLVSAFLFVIMSTQVGVIRKVWIKVVSPFVLVGMLVAQTRSVWLSLISAALIYRFIMVRTFRKPLLVLACVLGSFGLCLWVGDYALHHFGNYVTSNQLIARYTTVGTISARMSAPELFMKVLPTHLFIGSGLGSSMHFHALDSSLQATEEQYSHNVVVETLLYHGLPALLCLIFFYYEWLKEAFWVVRTTGAQYAGPWRWMIAIAVAGLITGSVGAVFMNSYTCLFLGMVSGEWIRLKNAQGRLAAVPRIEIVTTREDERYPNLQSV